jgi:hypothetical protein
VPDGRGARGLIRWTLPIGQPGRGGCDEQRGLRALFSIWDYVFVCGTFLLFIEIKMQKIKKEYFNV